MSDGWEETLPSGYRLDLREETGSTNDDVRAAARAGAPAGLVVVAERQLAGRGRRGAAWFSPPGGGLAFSVLLRPSEMKPLWPRLSLAAGLAVAEGLDRHGVSAEVKWPNDVWVGGRKIAGILVEAGDDFAIVGIGINVGLTRLPPELETVATSLALECGQPPERALVLASVLERLRVWDRRIGAGFDELLRRFRERCALTGRQVRLQTAEGPLRGSVRGIADGGELLLETPAGPRKIVQADEVRLLDEG
jgi:BirA family biotin operon repressor/biotin-[acetyl-CoA-carboxylase] ligase